MANLGRACAIVMAIGLGGWTSAIAWRQATSGSLLVKVTDPSRAPLPGATGGR